MRFPGRRAKDDESRDAVSDRQGRGAWFADPFGVAEPRWWDGMRWTAEVRRARLGEDPKTGPGAIHCAAAGRGPASREAVEEPDSHRDRTAGFAVSMRAAVGEELRVVPADDLTRSEWWRGRFHDTYDVLTATGRAASITLGSDGMTRMARPEGVWCLKKRRRLGWDFVIESADGYEAGQYSGRRWLPGGTIALTDDTRFQLRRQFNGRWRLTVRNSSESLLSIRTSRVKGGVRMTLTGSPGPPPSGETHVAVLTACAVLLLDKMIPGIPADRGGG
jgi:hypothetical protein